MVQKLAVKKPSRTFFERYDSITKREYDEAVKKDIPTYILIESSVNSEYHTYLRNKDNSSLDYAHVDSANVFQLIEDILSKPRNNPTHTFDKFSDIETWLKDQWAGLFKELLLKMSNQQQIVTLSSQVDDLKETNNTLKLYLEAVMTGITPDDSSELIKSEERKHEERIMRSRIKKNQWYKFLNREYEIELDDLIKSISEATSFYDFAITIGNFKNDKEIEEKIRDTFDRHSNARTDFNEIRTILGLKTFRSKKE